MYITKEELENRLKRTELSVITRTRKNRPTKETGGEDRLTHNERVLIGVLGQDDTMKNVAELMGVSTQTVSHLSRGMIAPVNGIDKDLKADIDSIREEKGREALDKNKKIQDQLITNLAAALGHVANNLDNTDATEASKIAVDMSKILDRVSGNREDRQGNKTAIIINVPPMKEERHYQSIAV